MGCFLSTNHSYKESSPSTPPPCNPLIEEETVVKEVLSETPTQSKPPIARFSPNLTSPKNPTFPSPNRRLHKHHQQNGVVFKNNQSGELSEDACSSVSESCDRNNFADGYDDVGKIRNGSPGKYRNRRLSRDGLVGHSPGRRSGPSPGRTRSGPSPGRTRSGPSPGRSRTGPDMDGNGFSNVKRRSTSPATRVDSTTRSISGASRSSSARRLTPGRVGSNELVDSTRSRSSSARRLTPGRVGSNELVDSTRTVEDDINYYRNNDTKLAPTNTESLENPLVSLECFIFL